MFKNQQLPKKLENYTLSDTSINDPVDIVIPWVNMRDPIWASKYKKHTNSNIDLNRYKSYGELELTVFTITKYIPWIRNIFIVTDSQDVLFNKTKYPKLKIIDHSQIIDKQFLPNFNSCAITSFFHKIPGLSENFLIGNDDTMVGRKIEKTYFFKNGLPCCRFITREIPRPLKDFNWHIYNTLRLAGVFANKNYPGYKNGPSVWGTHQISITTKQSYEKMWSYFKKEMKTLATYKIRGGKYDKYMFQPETLSKFIGIYTGKMLYNMTPCTSPVSLYQNGNARDFFYRMKKLKPKFYCVNALDDNKNIYFQKYKQHVMNTK